MLTTKPTGRKKVIVKPINNGCDQPIIIRKIYGSKVFADLRVTADLESGYWKIERSNINDDEFYLYAMIPSEIECEKNYDQLLEALELVANCNTNESGSIELGVYEMEKIRAAIAAAKGD